MGNSGHWEPTSGHLLLEHLDHVVVGAGATNLAEEAVQLRLSHEDTNVIEGSTEVILVQGAVLVDVHQLEAVLVHLELLLGEASLILTPRKSVLQLFVGKISHHKQ